ncbi:alpha/beta hydrolase [Microbacterium deminutum]|uniref:BD-FAE-like domain-containing protein n=1 Tax=Microbacterium deminutum TaxID=344164 RepID=A0ABP5CCV7_9MICO
MTRVIRDIPFASDAGFRPLSLDLHLPAGGGEPIPTIIELHGGGWLRGSRREFTPLLSDADSFGRITAAGFAVVAADYRLSGEARFPAQLDDVRRAIDWVHGPGAEFGLDAGRIVLWGGSAGGTLAALVGLEPASRVRGIIDWYGPADLLAMETHTRALGVDAPGESREDRWLGGWVSDVPDAARAASPVNHVHAGSAPFHLAHGDADDAVPLAQSEALEAALRAAGVEAELIVEPGAGHFWRDAAPERVAALFDRAIAFAARVTA